MYGLTFLEICHILFQLTLHYLSLVRLYLRTTCSIKPSTSKKISDINLSQNMNPSPESISPVRHNAKCQVIGWVNLDPQHFSTKIQPMTRRFLNCEERSVLEAAFRENHLPDKHTLEELARELTMTLRTVQVWFQNKRQTWKRKMTADCNVDNNGADNYYTVHQEVKTARKLAKEAQNATRITKKEANVIKKKANVIKKKLNTTSEQVSNVTDNFDVLV